MLIYDRGLSFGTCLGEAVTWPAVALAVTLSLVALASWAARLPRFAGLRVVPWVLLATGLLATAVMAAAMVAGVTARVELAGPALAVTSCRAGAAVQEIVPAADVRGRFRVEEQRRGPPSPKIDLTDSGGREIASLWLGHPGLHLDALERLVPRAVAEYRRWRDRPR